MPRFLDTRGLADIAIAICDRCQRKFPHVELVSDPNFPGLRVCKQDQDQFDPYRLAARKTERINIRFPRPDVSVAVNPHDISTGGYGGYSLSAEQNNQVPQNDGTLEGLEITPVTSVPLP
jgi:hypothetical protein